jgi:hypothetical protein
VFDEAGDALLVVEAAAEEVVAANRMAAELSGLPSAEIACRPLAAVLRAENPQRWGQLVEALHAPFLFPSQEGFWLRQAAEPGWLPVNLTVSPLSGGPRPLALLSARPVTERQVLLEQLRLSERRWRALLDSFPYEFFLKDRELRYTAANVAFCSGLQRSLDEVLGRDDFALFPRARAEKFRTEDVQVLATGRPVEEEELVEGDSVRLVIRLRVPWRETAGAVLGVAGMACDVTEQRRRLEHSWRTEKMASVRHLAGGIAHDFNNLLTVVLGNLGLARAQLCGGSGSLPVADLLGFAEQAGLRAANLTWHLLGFAGRLALHLTPLDLNPLLELVLSETRSWQPANLLVRTALGPNLWLVLADLSQLRDAFTELFRNAYDAMPAGGLLRVESRNVTLDEAAARDHHDGRPGEFVCVSVSDTGGGIRGTVLSHLYEPFFTTKEVGKGTGLSLALAWSIIKEHHGWIACREEEPQGTRFDVYLPRIATAAESTTGAHDAAVTALQLRTRAEELAGRAALAVHLAAAFWQVRQSPES